MSTDTVRFPCFGGEVAIEAYGSRAAGKVRGCVALALGMHALLTRFEPRSELSRLNADPRESVEASPLMCALAIAVRSAGEISAGLVDATCIDALEAVGYRDSLEPGHRGGGAVPGGPAMPAIPDPARNWSRIAVDQAAGRVTRPPGVRLDSGGLGKGLAADLIAGELRGCDAFAVDCGGDLRIGGHWGDTGRSVLVAHPDPDHAPIAETVVWSGAVATSGIGRRSWTGPDGEPAHHLIDPGRGRPANTGIVQATALAPTAVEAEIRAKTALLGGPESARQLVHGGWLLLADGTVVTARPVGVAA